jgi:hypothetical protein
VGSTQNKEKIPANAAIFSGPADYLFSELGGIYAATRLSMESLHITFTDKMSTE